MTSKLSSPSAYGLLQQQVGKIKAKKILEISRKENELSILPLPDPKPLILIGKNDQFDIIGQDVEVNIEKNMIKDQTNIPASILNKVTKIKNSIKEIFHKKAPTRITVTKPSGLENRTMTAPGGIRIIIIIVVIYLLIRGR